MLLVKFFIFEKKKDICKTSKDLKMFTIVFKFKMLLKTQVLKIYTSKDSWFISNVKEKQSWKFLSFYCNKKQLNKLKTNDLS